MGCDSVNATAPVAAAAATIRTASAAATVATGTPLTGGYCDADRAGLFWNGTHPAVFQEQLHEQRTRHGGWRENQQRNLWFGLCLRV